LGKATTPQLRPHSRNRKSSLSAGVLETHSKIARHLFWGCSRKWQASGSSKRRCIHQEAVMMALSNRLASRGQKRGESVTDLFSNFQGLSGWPGVGGLTADRFTAV